MVAELESHGGFVDRALVRERFHVSLIPVGDRVDSHKAGPVKITGPAKLRLKTAEYSHHNA
jgi:hypothetical protein